MDGCGLVVGVVDELGEVISVGFVREEVANEDGE